MRNLAAVMLIGLLAPTSLFAQDPEVRPRISVSPTLEVAYDGDAWDGLDVGPGAELRIEAFAENGWSVAAVGAVNFSGTDQVDVNFWKGMAELKKEFPTGSAAPYIGARLGLLHQAASVGDVSRSESGLVLGPTGGLMLNISSSASLDLGAAFYYGEVGSQPNIPDGGTALSLRTGITFAIM